MSYVTQGKIQVKFKTTDGAEIEVMIAPAQDYAVIHNGSVFTVFVDDNSQNQSGTAKIFEKTQIFVARQSSFVSHLIDAAVKQTKLEIRIKDSKLQRPKSTSPQSSSEIEIESVKIPATL